MFKIIIFSIGCVIFGLYFLYRSIDKKMHDKIADNYKDL